MPKRDTENEEAEGTQDWEVTQSLKRIARVGCSPADVLDWFRTHGRSLGLTTFYNWRKGRDPRASEARLLHELADRVDPAPLRRKAREERKNGKIV
jgi:hypothetical protein